MSGRGNGGAGSGACPMAHRAAATRASAPAQAAGAPPVGPLPGAVAEPGRAGAADGRPWRALVDAASAPYRAGGRFAWHFARGKLGIDPVFRHLVVNGLLAPQSRVLDIGCGQGLLASLLHAAAGRARQDGWPAHWAPPPLGCQVTGVELMPKDVRRGRLALDALGSGAVFICGDMRTTPFPEVDAVVILDVLHYIAIDEQDAVLARVRQALRPGGRLLLRVGDAAARRGFRLSQWVDRVVFKARGHRATPLHGRPLAQWTARLEALGFTVHAEPMSHGTPFANVLLVARLDDAPAATAAVDAAATAAANRPSSAAAAPAADPSPPAMTTRTVGR